MHAEMQVGKLNLNSNPASLVSLSLLPRRFWKRVVRGTMPPTDLRSGSSLVQISKAGPHGPTVSFVDAATVGKGPGQVGVPRYH